MTRAELHKQIDAIIDEWSRQYPERNDFTTAMSCAQVVERYIDAINKEYKRR